MFTTAENCYNLFPPFTLQRNDLKMTEDLPNDKNPTAI